MNVIEGWKAAMAFEPYGRPVRIEAEVETRQGVVEDEEYMPSLDHGVPLDVSLDNFGFFPGLARDVGRRHGTV